MKPLLTTAIAALSITAATESAHAKNWFEYAKLEQHGIDAVMIDVRSNGNSYTVTKSSHHKFKLAIRAKAKSGKRIAGIKLASSIGAFINESEFGNPNWTYMFSKNSIGGGNKRTISFSKSFNIKLNEIDWVGNNPVQACNHMLQQKMQQGKPRTLVLSKPWTISTKSNFAMNVVAAKPRLAKAGNVWRKAGRKWDDWHDSIKYKVLVRCLPSANNNEQIQSNAGSSNHAGKPSNNKKQEFVKNTVKLIELGVGISNLAKGSRPKAKNRPLRLNARPLSAQ